MPLPEYLAARELMWSAVQRWQAHKQVCRHCRRSRAPRRCDAGRVMVADIDRFLRDMKAATLRV